MNSDFKDALQYLVEEGVRFLVVGGYAVIHYTQPRFTKDLDIWLEPSDANAAAVARAFQRFGLPLVEVTQEDLAQPGTQFMAGIPPNAIDFITTCSNLDLNRVGNVEKRFISTIWRFLMYRARISSPRKSFWEGIKTESTSGC